MTRGHGEPPTLRAARAEWDTFRALYRAWQRVDETRAEGLAATVHQALVAATAGVERPVVQSSTGRVSAGVPLRAGDMRARVERPVGESTGRSAGRFSGLRGRPRP